MEIYTLTLWELDAVSGFGEFGICHSASCANRRNATKERNISSVGRAFQGKGRNQQKATRKYITSLENKLRR